VNSIKEEKHTVERMIQLFCKKKHKSRNGVCPECRELAEYSNARLDACKFKNNKPVCKNCTIHCYKPEFRQKIKAVMRFSGPLMLLYHPIKGIKHLIRGFKKL